MKTKNFCNWVLMLSNVSSNLTVWRERGATRANLPVLFKKKQKDMAMIIDCSEIFKERSKHLAARA